MRFRSMADAPWKVIGLDCPAGFLITSLVAACGFVIKIGRLSPCDRISYASAASSPSRRALGASRITALIFVSS